MASYEVEHNVPKPSTTEPSHPPRRPDLSTFFSTLEHVDTTDVSNGNAVPVPADVSAAYRTLAEAFERMRPYRSGDGPLDGMIELLVANSQAPPKEVKGVSQGFLDELERVPNKLLKPSMDCPICGNPFLEDDYPLVVRLPCNKNHMYDLECIAPWLKLHATCPLDRKDLVKEKEPPPPPKDEEEDGEWDDIKTNDFDPSTHTPIFSIHPSIQDIAQKIILILIQSNPPSSAPAPPCPPPHHSPQSTYPPSCTPPPTSLQHSTAAQLSTACLSPGFFHLTHHNLPPALTTRVLALARSFFLHAPAAEKARLARLSVGEVNTANGRYGDGARGYQVVGENVTGGKRDWHEAVDLYRPVREGEPFDGDGDGGEDEGDGGDRGDGHRKGSRNRNRPGPYTLLNGINAWPTYPEDFRAVYEEYVSRMLGLGTAVVRAMGLALGDGMEEVFVGNTRRSAWVMRAICYPPLPLHAGDDDGGGGGDGTMGKTNDDDEKGGAVSCGAHSDYGCVTLLLADGTKGALQAWVEGEGEQQEGGWVDVDPVEGALVVNIGDMMERWSGGKWKATRHRVVHKGKGFRVSVPFFFEPDWDARVPGRVGEGEVIYGEYLEGKVRGNF